jgi:hypothetical protein
VQRWQAGGWTITRVPDPGFELVLPQDDATRAALQRSPWLRPRFVTDDWALRVGSSAIVLDDGTATAIVDPWLAFDDAARFTPRLDALSAAGWSADDVDVVINSHIDGVGANVDPATGAPTFPRARYLVPGPRGGSTSSAPGSSTGTTSASRWRRASCSIRFRGTTRVTSVSTSATHPRP